MNPREAKPPENVYSITEPGRSALHDWIDQPSTAGSLKAFAMRLILENNLSRSGLIAHLQQRRSDVAGHQVRLAGVVRILDGAKDSGQHLTLTGPIVERPCVLRREIRYRKADR